MAIFKNFYHVLGVPDFADADAVKAAFRKLARQYHPDLNAGDASAEEAFKAINEAYETLGNPDKRVRHDVLLRATQGGGLPKASGKKQATGYAKTSPPPKGKPADASSKNKPPPTSSVSEKPASPSVSSSASQSSSSPPPPPAASSASPEGPPSGASANPEASPSGSPASSSPGSPKSSSTPIGELFESFMRKNFSEATGGKRASDTDEGIFRKKRDGASGASASSGGGSAASQNKPRRGEDVVVKTAISPLEALEGVVKTVNVQHNELCRRCSGTGRVNGAVCTGCDGEKVHTRLKKIDVRIPAKVKNGSRVRVAKEGGRGLGGAENGDLFLQIEIVYDPSLRIEGLDVYGDVALSVTDAVLGGEIEVMTLHGAMTMNIPPGTQTGRTFRLKERGVQSGLTQGDHFVVVTVVVPDNLSARERELYQELARLRPEKPVLKKPSR